MRGWASAVVGAVLVGLLSFPGDASAAAVLSVREARAATTDPVTAIEVDAYGDNEIVAITVELVRYRTSDVVATLDEFELVSGVPTDGVWRSVGQVDVSNGNYWIDVTLTDAVGTVTSRTSAGTVMNGVALTFEGLSVSPDHVDVDHSLVTVTGRLVREDTGQGVPGLQVQVISGNGNSYNSSFTTVTDAEGAFTGTLQVKESAEVRARTPADATYLAGESAPWTVTGRWVPTRLTMDVSGAPTYVVGDQVTVSGQLDGQAWSGEWYGLADKKLKISYWNPYDGTDTYLGSVQTSSDGSYQATIPVPGPGQWYVSFENITEDGREFTGYQAANAGTDFLDADYRSQIVGFNATPEPAVYGASVTTRGRVLRTLADGTQVPVADELVEVFHSTDGKTWTWASQGYTDADGYFSFGAKATRDGYWRAVYDGWQDLRSVSGSDHVDVRYRTAITGFNASPEPVRSGAKLKVTGKLSRYKTSWAGMGGKTVYVYFTPKGSTTRSYLGKCTTNSYGVFTCYFTAKRDGYWSVRYAGSTVYMAVTSSRDYVDVQ